MASGMYRYESNIEAIADSFTCFVCLGLAVNPHQCIHCGKMACLTCFQQCLENNSVCPLCRQQLQSHQLRRVGWYEDVIDNLKALQFSEKCCVHSKMLNLYCSDCRESICHKCVALDEKHHGHALNPLEDVYGQHVKEMSEEVARLKGELYNILQDMAREKERFNCVKSQCDKEYRAYFEDTLERFSNKMDEDLVRFVTQESALDAPSIHDVLERIEEQLKNSSESLLVSTSSSIFKDLQETKSKLRNFVRPRHIGVPNEIKPLWSFKGFVVNNFTQVLHSKERVYSDALQIDGWTWRMAICPNDCSGEEDYFGVALKLCESTLSNVSAEVEFRVRMLHCSLAAKNFDQTRVDTWGPNPGKEVIIDNFYKVGSLSSEGFLDTETDILKFEFLIRSPTFFEQCKKQKLIIAQLLEKQRKKDEKIKELEEKQALQEAREKILQQKLFNRREKPTRPFHRRSVNS